MWPWCKVNDEELENVVGGVTPNFIGKVRPIAPITEEPLPGEGAQFVPI